VAALWLAALCAAASVACERETGASDLPSLPVERLSFVPAARVALSSGWWVGNDTALLVSRFEVTRGEWRAWYLARGEGADPEARARVEAWERSSDSWPAASLSLVEARAYAHEQGLRLLGWREWLRVACGSAAALYPWGPNDAASVANTLELGLRLPTSVGTFEQGRAPLGIYDLVGNVWEWVEDSPDRNEPFAWAMGGSYLTLRRPLFDPRGDAQGTLHLALDPDGRSIEVGVRLCAEARPWLEAHGNELSGAPEAERRLTAVGRRWGSAAAPLLEELAAAHPGERAFGWLLGGARR